VPAIKLDNENIGGHLTPLHWGATKIVSNSPKPITIPTLHKI